MWQVFDCDCPADNSYINTRNSFFDCSKFDDFDTVIKYARRWVATTMGPVPYSPSLYGWKPYEKMYYSHYCFVEIRWIQ